MAAESAWATKKATSSAGVVGSVAASRRARASTVVETDRAAESPGEAERAAVILWEGVQANPLETT